MKVEWRVVRPLVEVMLVPRARGDQQHDSGGWERADQTAQELVGRGIHPVQVFDDQEQRLLAALVQENLFYRLNGSLLAGEWVERLSFFVAARHVEERQNRHYRQR